MLNVSKMIYMCNVCLLLCTVHVHAHDVMLCGVKPAPKLNVTVKRQQKL